ncbi:SRPBCC family protein [Hyalangium gracile]|uniref:SRPBCC family protein n=1 Tax=Hyalangium gracile TaxID=394092 RepID=UPI001CC9B74E|nr:SRPBCC family protein [Hyalangium gracile]
MGQSHIRFRATLKAPIEVVFERLTDHEDMRNWPGVTGCRLVREGTPRNGVGAVRVVSHPFISVMEEVNLYEPPRRIGYSIIKGMPIRHQGIVTLVERGEQVDLDWEVKISSRVPLLAQAIGRFIQRGLGHVFATYFVPKVEETARARLRPPAQGAVR